MHRPEYTSFVFIWLIILAVIASFSGCITSPLGSPRPVSELSSEEDFIVIDELHLPSVTGVAGCGAQALACVLAYVRPQQYPQPEGLAAELPWHDRGATPIELLLEARRRGCSARVLRGDRWRLIEAVRRGEAVIVMIDAGPVVKTLTDSIPTSQVMHWSVVSGMSRDGSRVLLAAEDETHHEVSSELFMSRWRESDNCMIIIKSED